MLGPPHKSFESIDSEWVRFCVKGLFDFSKNELYFRIRPVKMLAYALHPKFLKSRNSHGKAKAALAAR